MKDHVFNSFGGDKVFCLCLALLLLSLQTIYAQDGSLKWAFETGNQIKSSPAIGPEGIIYFGSFDDRLYAVQPDGTEKWNFDTGADIELPPVVAEDGTIYVGNDDGSIFALNPDGTSKWTFNPGTDRQLEGEMALAADGTLYASIGDILYAISPDRTVLWTVNPNGIIRGISIGMNGLVFSASSTGWLYALDSQGVIQWEVQIDSGISSPAIFDHQGTVYVASSSEVVAVNLDGTIKWTVETEGSRESPSIGINGDLYVPIEDNNNGGLLALDPATGEERWFYNAGTRVESSPAVGFEGTIYFGTDDDELIALTPDGAVKWTFSAEKDIRTSPTIAPDGSIYFGSQDDHLYALRSSSSGLAASSWPKKQRDVRNTGQSGSDVTRRKWFAPHVYWLSEDDFAIVTISHIGGSAGNPTGTDASFRIEVRDRDGSVLYTLEDSVQPGETQDYPLNALQNVQYAGSVIVDAPVKDGSFLAPFLTWQLKVKSFVKPIQIGAFFSDPTEAALVHHFPAVANTSNGLGLGVQNIGANEIDCSLEFFNLDGSLASEEVLELSPMGSIVRFFNSSVPEGFEGRATFSCDAPVVVIAVNQDNANGGFPTDRLTIKGF